jgi:hypothetical protein
MHFQQQLLTIEAGEGLRSETDAKQGVQALEAGRRQELASRLQIGGEAPQVRQ